MSTLTKKFISTLRGRMSALRATGEQGLQTAEVAFLVVGSLVIAGLVIAGVTAFVTGQLGQLP